MRQTVLSFMGAEGILVEKWSWRNPNCNFLILPRFFWCIGMKSFAFVLKSPNMFLKQDKFDICISVKTGLFLFTTQNAAHCLNVQFPVTILIVCKWFTFKYLRIPGKDHKNQGSDQGCPTVQNVLEERFFYYWTKLLNHLMFLSLLPFSWYFGK